MIYFNDDRFYNTLYTGSEQMPITYEKTGIVNYNSLYIANQEGDEPLFYNDDLKRYLNIRYEHFQVNWTLADGQDDFDMNRTYYEAV